MVEPGPHGNELKLISKSREIIAIDSTSKNYITYNPDTVSNGYLSHYTIPTDETIVEIASSIEHTLETEILASSPISASIYSFNDVRDTPVTFEDIPVRVIESNSTSILLGKGLMTNGGFELVQNTKGIKTTDSKHSLNMYSYPDNWQSTDGADIEYNNVAEGSNALKLFKDTGGSTDITIVNYIQNPPTSGSTLLHCRLKGNVASIAYSYYHYNSSGIQIASSSGTLTDISSDYFTTNTVSIPTASSAALTCIRFDLSLGGTVYIDDVDLLYLPHLDSSSQSDFKLSCTRVDVVGNYDVYKMSYFPINNFAFSGIFPTDYFVNPFNGTVKILSSESAPAEFNFTGDVHYLLSYAPHNQLFKLTSCPTPTTALEKYMILLWQ